MRIEGWHDTRTGQPLCQIETSLPFTGGLHMNLRPDPTFHASPKLAMEAPPENYAYTLMLSPDFSQPDGLAVVDVDPES